MPMWLFLTLDKTLTKEMRRLGKQTYYFTNRYHEIAGFYTETLGGGRAKFRLAIG